MKKNITLKKKYDRIVKFLLEEYANHAIDKYKKDTRELAKQYGFPTKRLEDALKAGILKDYYSKISLISNGHLYFEKDARELAKQYGFPTKRLEDALKAGILKDYYSKISLISNGHLYFEKDARELAKQYGFPTKRLEDALKSARRKNAERAFRTIFGTE
jgi:hypothetical protein